MDRAAILDKIAAMLALQESSDFEGESAAAAALIDKLCKKYGVTVDEATTPEVVTEAVEEYKRMNDANFTLFCAVASFYDAKGYVHFSNSSGRKVSTFKCIGTEAQQIQTKLYYEFLKDSMEKECKKTIEGERVLAEMLGATFSARGYSSNFNKAFASKVKERLIELKATRDPHEHKHLTALTVSKIKFGSHRGSGAHGWGAQMGRDAGSNVSLNKQTTGKTVLQLTGR
jgi:hypothetical protein